jgi:hypothetical protein
MNSNTISSDLNAFAIVLVSHTVLATPEAFIVSWDELSYSVLSSPCPVLPVIVIIFRLVVAKVLFQMNRL